MPEIKKRTVFVVGGARSGKSRFALAEASKIAGRKAFIATAAASDDEMSARIEKHRQDRSNDWETFEEPVNLSPLIMEISGEYDVIIIDCLTLWLSNLMFSDRKIEEEFQAFISCVASSPSSLFIIANEVGLGIVPDNPLARSFRDLAGFLNQRVAGAADEAYLMAAGIPLKIK
jgi:adenosylcobinamide kinase/adenosylcobinamide-phosphate guanylyltransferase